MSESIRIAVRCRPFNDRERSHKTKCIIDMPDGKTTSIKDPDEPAAKPKIFTFDYSYWSHDGFNELENGYLEPANEKYADQKKVFDDLGKIVLKNSWAGFNCSLFAYGQTGSGKSYSMVGYGQNKGIVPVACETLFTEIAQKREADGANSKNDYTVTISMLEIYSEIVRDLLNLKSFTKQGLKVRQDPKKGFYCEGLTKYPVNTYAEIERIIDEGTKNRTVQATNMNATSSRAHTIVSISFQQKSPNAAGQMMTKSSQIALVDLAGSERAESTGATGDRLKEGAAINQSLSILGNCIKALADSKKKTIVPYRDSKLTMLLKNALGGNSKTIMIAALSPAGINYDETLSTLRFADRAKAIKTKAVINESPTDKLIRELREEIMKLKKGGGGKGGVAGMTDEEKTEMERLLKENEEEMSRMRETFAERLQTADAKNAQKISKIREEEQKKKVIPHLWNLNEDPQLTGMVTHFLAPGKLNFGSSTTCDILLKGVGIKKNHVEIVNTDNSKLVLREGDGDVLINGNSVDKEIELEHGDRIMFGSNHVYVLFHPQDASRKIEEGKLKQSDVDKDVHEQITYESFQAEIAEKRGFNLEGKSPEDLFLQEDLIKIMPMVTAANAMSEELQKNAKYEIVLVSPQLRGEREGMTDVYVKLKDEHTGNIFYWKKDEFINRKFEMQEVYQDYLDDNEDWDRPEETDPFLELPETESIIGIASIYIASLGYLLETEEVVPITDYKAEEVGYLDVKLYPCSKEGVVITDEFVEDPKELLGKSVNALIRIISAKGLPGRVASSFSKYKFFNSKEDHQSQKISGTINPTYNDENIAHVPEINQDMLNHFEADPLVIEIWGTQKRTQPRKTSSMKLAETADIAKAKEEAEQLRNQLEEIRKLVQNAKSNNEKYIKVAALEEILNSHA